MSGKEKHHKEHSRLSVAETEMEHAPFANEFESDKESDTESDVDVEECDNPPCTICYRQSKSCKLLNALPEQVQTHLILTYQVNLVENGVLCEPCLIKFQNIAKLQKIPDNEKVKSRSKIELESGGTHSECCSYCNNTLLLPNISENEDVTMEEDGGNKPSFINHKHLSFQGCVSEKTSGFVKFALRCKHRDSRRRPTLSSCLCQSCYRILYRKYEMSIKVPNAYFFKYKY